MARVRWLTLLPLTLFGCGGGGSSNTVPPAPDYQGVYQGVPRDGSGSILGAAVGRVSDTGDVQFQISSTDASVPELIEGTLSKGQILNGEARLADGSTHSVTGTVSELNGNIRFAFVDQENASQVVISAQERTWAGTYGAEIGFELNGSYVQGVGTIDSARKLSVQLGESKLQGIFTEDGDFSGTMTKNGATYNITGGFERASTGRWLQVWITGAPPEVGRKQYLQTYPVSLD